MHGDVLTSTTREDVVVLLNTIHDNSNDNKLVGKVKLSRNTIHGDDHALI